MIFRIILFSFLFLSILSCNSVPSDNKAEVTADPLPSWNEGKTKQSIMEFVKSVIDEKSPDFVPVVDRIATFDNDGTLWAEKPVYFQFQFAVDRLRAMTKEHIEGSTGVDWDEFSKDILKSDINELLNLVMMTHAGMNTEEFEQIVSEWINSAKHESTGKLYKEMVYQPMLELIRYLEDNEFDVYIVSGGGIEFMRPWTEEVYGIPPQNVIGSSIKVQYQNIGGTPELRRLAEIDFIDDKEGKPVAIHKFIGKRPVASFGNSDGDLQMMQWTDGGEGRQLLVYIHHTDAEREWAYDKDSHVGKLSAGLDEAKANGWTVVNMKEDWKTIYKN